MGLINEVPLLIQRYDAWAGNVLAKRAKKVG